MGIEPTSEAWEACNLTQKTLDWRHFCNFRNALIGKQMENEIGCRGPQSTEAGQLGERARSGGRFLIVVHARINSPSRKPIFLS